MALTHLELSNIASCTIKGGKCWNHSTWLGDDTESLILTDGIKSRRLNISDGSITKHIPLIDRLINESKSTSVSCCGKYLIGIKKTGEVFVWNYAKNVVFSLLGIDAIKDKEIDIQISVADYGNAIDNILITKSSNQHYLWVRQRDNTRLKLRHPPKQTHIEGRWYTLDVRLGVELPDVSNHEAVVDQYVGEKIFLSSTAFIDNTGVLQLSTLFVNTAPSMYGQRVAPYTEWYSQSLAGSADIPITTTPELLLVRYAPTTPLCAVIINQVSVRDQCVLFVSPQHDYQVSANLRCLRDSPTSGRSPIWISDVKWTYNSLLLVILTQSGCVAVLSRLGNPLYITTREMSLSGGCDHLLSLLPRNVSSVKKSRGLNRSLSLTSAAERYVSLSCHHKSMKFLITDGVEIMIFQIPEDVTTRSLAMAMLSDVRSTRQDRLKQVASAALSLTQSSTHDLESSLRGTQELPQDSELKTLIQIWCLLISSDQWSRELKDVSNEVIRHIAEIIHCQIDPNNIQLSAIRIVRTAVTLVTMVTIDSQRQHMLPASVKLISLLVRILLGEDNFSVNTRVTLAKITYVLIKVCEGILTRTYTALPVADSQTSSDSRLQTNITHEVVGNTLSVYEKVIPHEDITGIEDPTAENISLSVRQSSLPTKCLAPLYQKIQKHLMKLYRLQDEDTDTISIHNILEAVQSSLQHTAQQQHLPAAVNSVWLQSDILSLEGFHSSAVREWLTKYREAGLSQSRLSDILHSVLYNKLYYGKLYEALQFVENLVVDTLNSQHQVTDKEYLNVRTLPVGSAVRRLVQSLARFMARYFTSSAIYVFPAHHPQVMPPLYTDSNCSQFNGVLGIDRKLISDASARLVSEDMWSVGATVRYLLISGLISELVWFCKSVGDLKTSLSISLLVSDHQKSIKHIKRHEVNTVLPDNLKPESMHTALVAAFMQGEKDSLTFRPSIHHLMLPTALFGLSCINTQLSSLWQQIKLTACKFSALPPNELYLPCPELYCTQVPLEGQEIAEELQQELELRQTLAVQIHSLIDVLVGTNTDLPCCGWYVRNLSDVWRKENKDISHKNSKLTMSKQFETYKPHHLKESDKQNKLVFAIFRNMCSILWMLHVRDKLSIMLRKSTELLQNRVTVTTETDDAKSSAERNKHMEETLEWCLRFLPFAQYLQCTNSICEVVISVCEDLPPTARLAKKLSQGITDIDALAPEVKDRMDHLLQTWQTIDLDPEGSRSLSMYYFECCHKQDRHGETEKIEKVIFSTPHGHKHVGTRGFEFDSTYPQFLELFFSVCFQPSLPAGGIVKSPALVATNRKALEQIHLSKHSPVFNVDTDNLEVSLINQHHTGDQLTMTAGALTGEHARSDSPNKSGMFRHKRWSSSEAQTMKQMKRLGVSQTSIAQDSIYSGSRPASSRPASGFGIWMDPPVSQQMLTQNIKLSERYQRLAIKYQWLQTWCERHVPLSTAVSQPSSKVEIELQWLIIALIMVEKSRHGTKSVDHSLPPRYEEKLPPPPTATAAKSPPKAENSNNSALANALSLHTSTDAEDLDEEEVLDRQEIMEEMRRHSRLATATQPINSSDTKLTLDLQTLADDADKSERLDAGTDGSRTARTGSVFLEDSATTVWSSASLPNMSGSSHMTVGPQADTVETIDQPSTSKTQQSVSTIGSRKGKGSRNTPEKITAGPIAESTQIYTDDGSISHHTASAQSGAAPITSRINCQIPLLHLSKENSNNPYYASTVPHDRGQSDPTKPRQQLGHRPTQQRPEILQVHDLNNPNMQPESTQPDSVRLPLLSLKPCRVQDFGGRKVHDSRRLSDVMDDQRLAEIRQNDQRWSRSVPLLNNRQEQITHEPSGEQMSHGLLPKPSNKSIALGFGPALLQEYDENNRQKEELIGRMIRAMRAESKPISAVDGRPTHPKYSLLKLDPPPAEEEHVRRPQRQEERPGGGYRERNEPRKARRNKTDRKKRTKSKVDKRRNQDDELATLSERTEKSDSPATVEAGTGIDQLVETKDQSVQHSPAHKDDKYTDYSYLFELAVTKDDGDVGEPVRAGDLDAAADENTYAATQYKAMKLQQEPAKPKMVDASVMAVSSDKPRTIIVRQERPRERDAPGLAPNLIHDLQFTRGQSRQQQDYTTEDKENVTTERRQYLGVVDIPVPTEPMRAVSETKEDKVEPRSKQILQELRSNSEFIHTPDVPKEEDEKGTEQLAHDTLHIPYYESEELSPPRLIAPRNKRFEGVEVKGEGRWAIQRNLCNMEDRLDYIEQLRQDMMQQIENTDMVLPRYHISYQQRQTQTRLSMPREDDIATILQPPESVRQTNQDNLSANDSPLHHGREHPGVKTPGSRRGQITSQGISTLPDSARSTQQTPHTDRSARARHLLARLESGAESSRVSVAQTGSAINTARTARTARTAGAFSSGATTARSEGPHSMMDETADMIRQAEHIIGDDASMTGDINSSMLAELLGSDTSLLSPHYTSTGGAKSKEAARRKTEELKKWRKENRSRVKEKYNEELARKRKPEAHPFSTDKALTGAQIKKVKKAQRVKREEMISRNQNRRIESAENLLEDLIEDGAELLALERMMDLTKPIVVKKATPKKSASRTTGRKPPTLKRGKSTIKTDPERQSGFTPRGYHTIDSVNAAFSARAQPIRSHNQPFSSYSPQHYQSSLVSASYDRDEAPLEDESHLLVPIFKGEQTDEERIHRLLYSDDPPSRYGSELNLSNLSDLISEADLKSELSGESFLDWDVVDEMVAMLSNREVSTPSTLNS